MNERFAIIAIVACAACLAGCATPPPIVLREAVGPWEQRAAVNDDSGQLVVYSATRVTTTDDSEYPVHTPYTIYGADEKPLENVNNRTGLFSQSPSSVSLPPGRYQVKALTADSGYVIVPVLIVAHRTTVVDLDGTVLSQDDHAHQVDAAHWVRLPNGRVIGADTR